MDPTEYLEQSFTSELPKHQPLYWVNSLKKPTFFKNFNQNPTNFGFKNRQTLKFFLGFKFKIYLFFLNDR